MTEPTEPASSPTPSEEHSSPELPLISAAALAKATGIALVTAIVLLVLVVLPAEFNIDPTGFGEALGLTRLSAPEDEAIADSESGADSEDRVVVELAPGKSVEYKFFLKSGDKMKFSWEADAGPLRFDFHGEAKADKKDRYESYTKATARKTRGTFTAPFSGIHGWWWKNTGTTPAKVTLTTSGSYKILGLR